jgi:prepilin-type processing-associated H-X9-DG protein/prepilin-type N-terminal cleavage/methylation domain-containing protein
MKNIRHQCRDGFKTAFTLIELLVVISIIALLLSILMPSLNKAREQGKSAVCKSQIKMVGLGMMLYVNENRGYLPPYCSGRIPAGESYTFKPTGATYTDYVRYSLLTAWSSTSVKHEEPPRGGDGFLGVYLQSANLHDMRNVLGCPSLPANPTLRKLTIRKFELDCYVYREKAFALNYEYTTAGWGKTNESIKLTNKKKPSSLVFMADGSGNQLFIEPPNRSSTTDPREGNTFYVPAIRHSGNFNMVFCDGHVESGNWEKSYIIQNFNQ